MATGEERRSEAGASFRLYDELVTYATALVSIERSRSEIDHAATSKSDRLNAMSEHRHSSRISRDTGRRIVEVLARQLDAGSMAADRFHIADALETHPPVGKPTSPEEALNIRIRTLAATWEMHALAAVEYARRHAPGFDDVMLGDEILDALPGLKLTDLDLLLDKADEVEEQVAVELRALEITGSKLDFDGFLRGLDGGPSDTGLAL